MWAENKLVKIFNFSNAPFFLKVKVSSGGQRYRLVAAGKTRFPATERKKAEKKYQFVAKVSVHGALCETKGFGDNAKQKLQNFQKIDL